MDKKKELYLFFVGFIILNIFLLLGISNWRPRTFNDLNLSFLGANNPSLDDQHAMSVDSTAVPRLAYLISGSKGDGMQMRRTLQAIYHPRNYYALHLDLKASAEERDNIYGYVHDNPIFQKAKNVVMVEDANSVTYAGPTMFSTTLHGAAVLLKEFKDWDWFINLSAKDYPLATQDDILDVFSSLPRNLNFIEHTKLDDHHWKVEHRLRPIYDDPGLYMTMGSPSVIRSGYSRQIPTAYDVFSGSAWMVLSRAFVEYTIIGWDNWPRKILMYYANTLSPAEGYFQTVLCKSKEFKNTVANHDLHYIAWDSPPKQHPMILTMKEYDKMKNSGAFFARKIQDGDPLLALIDKELLGRASWEFTPGGWCVGSGLNSCAAIGDTSRIESGPSAERLKVLIRNLLAEPNFHNKQCQ